MDVQAIRRDFPALEQYTWFQNGGVSITPVPVAAEYTRWTEEMVRRGPLHIVYPEESIPGARRRWSGWRSLLARRLGSWR